MPLYIGTSHTPAATLFATLQRLLDGFYWNVTASAWQAAPAVANKKVTLTEGSGENVGSYTASVTGLGDAGFVRVRVHDDADADETIKGDDVYVWGGEEVGGNYLVTINAKTVTIGSGSATVPAPLTVGGDLTLYRGDSYKVAQGRSLPWTDDGEWPTLTGATITLEIEDGLLVADGDVVTATGSPKEVRVELSGTDTSSVPEGVYTYRVVATFPGTGTATDRVTLAAGACHVLDRED